MGIRQANLGRSFGSRPAGVKHGVYSLGQLARRRLMAYTLLCTPTDENPRYSAGVIGASVSRSGSRVSAGSESRE